MRPFDTNAGWGDSEALLEAQEIEAGLSEVLAHAGEEATPEHVDRWLSEALSRLTPVESESVGRALSALGSARNVTAIRAFAGQALPTVGTIVGTAYGGPVGAGVGGSLGQLAGQAVAGAKRPSEPSSIPSTQAPGPAPGAAAEPGSQAAGQLLYLIQNPAFLTSLLALAMGSHGRASIPVGEKGTEVPSGAFMNLLSTFAGRAAQEADALALESDEPASSYLLDSEGRFLCDPAVPAQRADVLLRLLEREEESFPSGEEGGEVDLEGYALEGWDSPLQEGLEAQWEEEW